MPSAAGRGWLAGESRRRIVRRRVRLDTERVAAAGEGAGQWHVGGRLQIRTRSGP